jgi:hypothetical protein
VVGGRLFIISKYEKTASLLSMQGSFLQAQTLSQKYDRGCQEMKRKVEQDYLKLKRIGVLNLKCVAKG